MKVSIGFSKHNGSLLSKIICWAQGTPYSHAYIRKVSKYGEYIYQASGLQVNFMNIDTFLSHNTIIEEYEFDITEEQHGEMMKFCIKYAGRPYSVKALFQIAAKILAARFNQQVDFKGDGDQSFVCSELADLFAEKILLLSFDVDEDFISPKEVNAVIAKYGKRVI